MERPGWVGPVGIIGIVMACLGLLGTLQLFLLPVIKDAQREMETAFHKEIEEELSNLKEALEKGETVPPEAEKMIGLFRNFMELPDWFVTWAVASALLQAVTSLCAIVACIGLLQMKRAGLVLFYWSAGTKLAFVFLDFLAASVALSFPAFLIILSGAASFIVLGALLLVVAFRDKKAFHYQAAPPPPPWEL